MQYKFHCTHCGQRISADSTIGGGTVSCPTCGGSFSAPLAPDTSIPETQAIRVRNRNTFPSSAVILLVVAAVAPGWWYFQTHAQGQLDGQVFIATQGGDNIKLGLVEIGVVPIEQFAPWLKQKTAFVDSESERLQASMSTHIKGLEDEKYYEEVKAKLHLFEADFYFEDFPKPMLKTSTDADGKFSVTLPRGRKFVLAARAKRNVGKEEEKYAWILYASLDGQRQKSIVLSNDNVTSSFSFVGPIHTAERLRGSH